ncbi:MAG: 5-dehydro-2-deoxygluconokinase [Acidimicrobiales bacterium]|nr:MAG: adenosine kinase [Actinomycetota bacterium]MBV6507811.1 5-dehydro-2-deoxygluconokinase [Acidimicrobiales bacterium]RIK06042.1 MAG: adenosine kinase [Acidobacteriota bacterium]
MTEKRLDVLCIGNAIVDVLCQVDEDFVEEQGLLKGSMQLIDESRSHELYESMGPATEVSGGSGANTAAGIASLGGRVGFIGKVRDDQLGEVFTHDIRSAGVRYTTDAATAGPSTARCLVLVTPDAQRTMSTYLGISAALTPDDIDESAVAAASITYCEGYLWDAPHAKAAIRKAMEVAAGNGGRVAFTLSDGFCVDRHRAEFLDLAENHVDILFGNEAEITSLYEVDTFDEAMQFVRGHCEVACLTRSEHGSVIISGDEVHVIDASPPVEVLDTTGAGDLYAAGLLYGVTSGFDLATAGRIASIAAAEVIDHIGARPRVSLAELVRARL